MNPSATVNPTSTNPAKTGPTERQMMFGAAKNVFALSSRAEAFDVEIQLSARLSHLSALLAMISGEGFESFTNQGAVGQHDILWACSSMATECEELMSVMGELQSQERGESHSATASRRTAPQVGPA